MQYINIIYQMNSLFICFSTCEVEPVLTQYSLISSQITSTAIATTGTQKGKDGADGENLEVTELVFKRIIMIIMMIVVVVVLVCNCVHTCCVCVLQQDLCTFLISRACKNSTLANYLYW